MKPDTPAKLRALGAELSPAMMQGTNALMTALATPTDPAVAVTRDQRYGSDARNRLDIFRKGTPTGVPVLVYVHGGGFIMGDKTSPGSPFYDNVGQRAAQQGWIGVTVTYRLAPAHHWPCGPEDMAQVIRWLQLHIERYGGNPAAIFLMGQSAGAAHVAAYVSHPHFHPEASPGIAGALMISGIYDPTTQAPNPFNTAYYGDEPGVLAAASTIEGLLASNVPQLFTVSEFDPRDFQDQAAQLAQAWHRHKGSYPPLEYLAGHNHLSPAQSIGSVDDDLTPRIAHFMAVNQP